MLTSLRSSLLALAIISLIISPAPAYAGPCEAAGGLGCAAEGENPGSPGNPGNPGNNGGQNGQGGNNDPGDGLGLDNDLQIPDEVPEPEEAAEPNTEDTIAKAFNQIEFPVPTIHVAPEPKTYVRVKTTFWIPEEQAEPLEVQASVGEAEGVQPQTITAVAKLEYVLWDLVEDELICKGPGRPNGEEGEDECEYHFKTSSIYHGAEAFEITATPYWNITWTCAGACPDGTAGIVDAEYASPAGELDLVVDEIQTEANKN